MLNISPENIRKHIDSHYQVFVTKYPEYGYLLFKNLKTTRDNGERIVNVLRRQYLADSSFYTKGFYDSAWQKQTFATKKPRQPYKLHEQLSSTRAKDRALRNTENELYSQYGNLTTESLGKVMATYRKYGKRLYDLPDRYFNTCKNIFTDKHPHDIRNSFSNRDFLVSDYRLKNKMDIEWEYTPQEAHRTPESLAGLVEDIKLNMPRKSKKKPQSFVKEFVSDNCMDALKDFIELDELQKKMAIPEKQTIKPINTHSGVVTQDDLDTLGKW